MSDQFLGEIRIFGCNYAPYNWALCNGQILPIATNAALFSLLGTNYGGNGTSNFGLPNLQGSTPMCAGQGPGLSPYYPGDTGGSSTVTLNTGQIPVHSHSFSADPATKKETNQVAGNSPSGAESPFYSTHTPNVVMNQGMLSSAGGNQGHDNMQPYLVLNFCIALQGIYPPRG